jgi:hypothetical protein
LSLLSSYISQVDASHDLNVEAALEKKKQTEPEIFATLLKKCCDLVVKAQAEGMIIRFRLNLLFVIIS